MGRRDTTSRGRLRAADDDGFTLIELIVTAIVVGVLAAIAIPSFFGQRNKARDADAVQSLRTAQLAIETYAAAGNGRYGGADRDSLVAIEPVLNDGALTVTSSPATYEITVASDTGSTFSLSRAAGGLLTRSCAPPDQGACSAAGEW